MFNFNRPVFAAVALLLGLGGIVLQQAAAGPIDISNTPVASTGIAAPKPNVMLLMDTSKSMAFTHMPDELEDTQNYQQSIGYRSAQCNPLYYDPTRTYTIPKNAAQLPLPTPSFQAARYSYYSSSDTSLVDLSTSFRAYDRNTLAVAIANTREDTAQPAYYYVYTGAGTLSYASAPCTDKESVVFAGADFTQTVSRNTTYTNASGTSVTGTWKRVRVGSTSSPSGADETANFAIWYTYYRTRMAMVKSSVSTAFAPITDKFRIGFVSMNPLNDSTVANSGVATGKYLAIDDFTDGQKTAWYSKIYSQEPNGSSPAREGLARVGRHYAGRSDGINTSMSPDPVQYSCQQNFTIMTTDGYWNTAQETVGPVMLDGTTKVGNQDGSLTPKLSLDNTDPTLYSHRPIWDGTTSGKRTDTNRFEQKRYAPCESGEFYKTTSIIRMSTSQTLQRTQALTMSTSQISMSTRQTTSSTSQEQKTTASATRQTLQALASTQQTTRSTRQEFKRTVFYVQGTSTVTRSTRQVLQTTAYTEKRQTTRQAQTTQITRTVSRQLQSTSQLQRTTLQYKVSTSQNLKTDTTYYRSTTTTSQATSQIRQTTTRQFQRTSQLVRYDGATEQATPAASCTQSGNISCLTLVTGPTAVASCTPQSASAGNNYLAVTCDTPTVVGPTPVQSCTPASASSSNNFTSTTCATQTTGPTVVVASSCSAASASSSNNWTQTTCTPTTTAETQVASCSAGTSGTTTTNCRAVVLSSDVPVQTCSAGTSGTTATTCRTATTGPTAIASCANVTASSGNSWTTTTCTSTSNGPTGVQTCTAASPTSANSFTQTTCNTATTGPTQVASCAASAAASGNSWKATTCAADSSVASTGFVQSCTSQTPATGNSFVKIDCTSNVSSWTNNASCTTTAASSTNNYVSTACRDFETLAATPVQPTACTAGTSNGVTTTCTPVTLTDVPVASCTASTTSTGTVTCRTVATGPTAVASCTPASATAANSWVETTCNTTNTTIGNVQNCTPVAAGPGNGNVATTCNTSDITLAVQPGTCVAQTGSAANNWVTVTCPAAQTTGPTPVPLNSCTTTAPTAGNSWVATTCTTTGPTTPAPVASCTSGTNPTTYVVTACTNANSAVQSVAPGSCTNVAASAGNQWTQTVCTGTSNTVNVAAGTCTPSAPGVLPVVTCNTVTTGPTFVADGSCSAGTDNNFLTTTCNTTRTGPTLVGACTPSTDANFKVTRCSTATTGPTQLALGTTCRSEAASASNNWMTTVCSPSDDTVGVAAGTCTPSAPGVLPVITCSVSTTGPTPAAACTQGTSGNFLETSCAITTTPPERTTNCTPVAPSAANGFQSTACEAIPGTKVQIKTQTTTTTSTVSGPNVVPGTEVAGPVVETPWTDVAGGICYANGATLPTIDASTDWKQSTTDMPSGCSKWPCTGEVNTSSAIAGSLNSLADVAQYYYVTDLRPDAAGTPNKSRNDVPKLGSGIEDDRAPWQHMTTFVLGLGVSGTLKFQSDYKSALSGDFSKIRSYENTPALNWPIWPTSEPMPSSLAYNDGRSIDDFWHTAVNGRGKFFAANDPEAVVSGLKEALAGIAAQAGAGAGASTSTLNPVAGDNTAFTGSYTSSEWTGDLKAEDINLTTGNLSGTVKWTARSLLDLTVGQSCDNRKIYVRDPAGASLVDFTWNTSACNTAGNPAGSTSSNLPSALRSYFTDASVIGNASTGLSQYSLMSSSQRTAAVGQNLVNFIRGQTLYQGFVANDDAKLYRTRTHALGDIVSSQPTYVKAPSLSYQDTGYAEFKAANVDRTPMIYVGANDGMLHAFYAPNKSTDANYAKAGQEAWAYIPTAVIPNLYKLADANYAEKHTFFVDGTATSGDVYDAGASKWRSIIVGGLGAGGKGYYALDVTNPTSPKSLWEFNFAAGCSTNPVGATSDCNVGLSFGRPVITKLKNGKWVVMVTSGYNNISGSGADGKGYLYVLDASSGAVISRISTNAGDVSTPSGLRELNFFVDNIAYDNTALRVYGTDILGNVWRFDINDIIAPAGMEATLIGTARDASNRAQPITTRPALAEVRGNTIVLVATGRLLATSDLSDTSVQTVYAIKDPMSATSPSYTDLRASLSRMQMTQTGSGATATRTTGCYGATATDCASDNGWYIDLPDGGERVNIDPQIVRGTLVFASNVPSDTMCLAGGYSWLNYLSLVSGKPVATSPNGVASVPFFSDSLVVGMGLIGIGDKIKALGRSQSGEIESKEVPPDAPPPIGKRISWREITQ
ncbi:PilC/PilY family type IV pilus protein [Variovorax sp. J22R24]|uniref:PilC/PilY family type IV pilus protein n=1 Tax=Variovorax gracilis TaxID=3053502 RepID=UPI002575416B|nr:PilC/PilY family type IV pilus protein [Variovorax sp. J22R24]MDM0106023.1 PilC/PilY family type IV pilus protein [Variovorax sp. J22R24]